MFRRLVVSVASGREVQLNDLLEKELSPVPLALATTDGNLRSTNKAHLTEILEKGHITHTLPACNLHETVCTIIDGMALVHALGKPVGCKNFGDLADIFIQSVCSNFTGNCTRVDILFDRYGTQSIKSGTPQKRRKGVKPIRRIIDDRNVRLPDNWLTYLAMEDNKRELTSFLSVQLSLVVPKEGCELIVSGGFSDPKHIHVTSSNENHMVDNLSCTHEEADTRIILHAHEAATCFYVVVARDTDVLVLLI